MVEQRFCKPLVVGSSPTTGSIFNKMSEKEKDPPPSGVPPVKDYEDRL